MCNYNEEPASSVCSLCFRKLALLGTDSTFLQGRRPSIRSKPSDKGQITQEKDKPATTDKSSDKTRDGEDGQDRKVGDDEGDERDERDKGPSILSVDQSAITGESLAVEKYVGEIAYYTCGVKRGKALGMVSCSAKQSFVGKTAALVMGSSISLPFVAEQVTYSACATQRLERKGALPDRLGRHRNSSTCTFTSPFASPFAMWVSV